MSRLPTARCSRCRQRKPLSQFYLRRTGRPLSSCKDCQRRAVRAAEHQRRQDPVALVALRAVDRDRQRRHRRWTPRPDGGDAA